jgi:aspartyl-tRNA(Asn)/glutamyl-tRNA(Gln) amidotransferase subunit C
MLLETWILQSYHLLMTNLISKDIIKLSKLSNQPLKKSEIDKYKTQLDMVLRYVNELNEIDTKNIEPTSQTTGLENITRDDKSTESLDKDLVLSESKNIFNDYFKVPLILKEKDI